MNKKLLFAFAIVLAAFSVYFIATKETATEKARIKYANFIKNHPYTKTLQLTKKERKANGIPPNKYFEQEYLLEMNPNTGRTHPENVFELQKQLKANRKLQRVPGDAVDNMWVERGPNNVGGRTRVVMFDPNDLTHKRVFAGGVSGGLWVNNDITNANSSWTRVGIDENLSISCMTVDPNNSQIMYVGTGESYTGDQAVGNGIWKSTDGGTSWVNVYSDTFNADVTQRVFYINDIKARNNGGNTEVYFAVAGAYYAEGEEWVAFQKTGLYKSIDNGTNWNKITLPAIPGSATPYEPNDIEIGSDNTIWIGTERNPWGFGGGTILKSTDAAGTTFTAVHSITNARRTEIAVSGTNANTVYVLAYVRTVDGGGNTIAPYLSMLKTTDGFTNTTAVTLPSDADNDISSNDFTRGQAFYDLVIEVDPTDDTKIYAGGIDLFRSTNSGTSWKQISKWSNNNNLAGLNVPVVHADQHGWAFHPTDANKAIIGNDGGVYYASSLSGAETTTNAISSRNKDYNVTQFYHGDIGQNAANVLLISGAQDNGTQFMNGASAGINSSIEPKGGDGAYSFIDRDGAYFLASYVYNDVEAFPLPYNGNRIEIIDDDKAGSFINPATLDDNLDILFTNFSKTIAGNRSYNLARFTNLLTVPVKTEFTNGLLTGEPTAFKVSPYELNSTKLFVGTNDGKLLRIQNANSAGPVWSDITGGAFPAGSVSSIAFGATENEIIVTFHNYGVASIWYTSNGGTTWVSKEGNFPDIPVKAIMMNPLNNDEVIIGTELGVWRTGNFKDANPSWSQSYNGMSNVKVTSFSLRTADNTVMASTFGRGMFTGQFFSAAASVDDVVKDNKVFTMYPTVSSGEFTVFAKNTVGKATLMLFDINGKQVFSKQVDFTQQEKQLVTVNLTSGVYIVNLIDKNNRKATEKVIIK